MKYPHRRLGRWPDGVGLNEIAIALLVDQIVGLADSRGDLDHVELAVDGETPRESRFRS
jgi:hypothetical protein